LGHKVRGTMNMRSWGDSGHWLELTIPEALKMRKESGNSKEGAKGENESNEKK